MAQHRNYRQEYRRRLERALARGLSRSQARGHAKPGEPLVKPNRAHKSTETLEAALKSLHGTGSLQLAARLNHVSPNRLKRYLVEHSLVKREGRKWLITDNRPREMLVLSDGRRKQLILPDFENASLNGRHLAAVHEFLLDQDDSRLEPFVGKSILDHKGNPHVFETDPEILYVINLPGSGVYEQVYRFVQ